MTPLLSQTRDELMRLALSSHTFLPTVGGAEVGVHEIATRMALRHEVVVITTAPPPGPQVTDALPLNYEVRYLWRRRETVLGRLVAKTLFRTSLPTLVALLRLKRQQPLDAVNLHFFKQHSLPLALLSRCFRVPVVLSLVGRSDVLADQGRVRRRWLRWLAGHADAVVSNSAYYTEGHHVPRERVIPYGVDTETLSPLPERGPLRRSLDLREGDFVLLSVQRLAPVKRVDVLLRVFARSVATDADQFFVIVGAGEEESRLKGLARELGVTDRVRFAGYVTDKVLVEYFRVADVFVFHSMNETFGIVFAQAMSAGLPIIAASTSCVGLVVDSAVGRLVEPFDEAGFAAAIAAFRANATLRTELGEVARARAIAEYDWNAISGAYERVLEDVSARG